MIGLGIGVSGLGVTVLGIVADTWGIETIDLPVLIPRCHPHCGRSGCLQLSDLIISGRLFLNLSSC